MKLSLVLFDDGVSRRDYSNKFHFLPPIFSTTKRNITCAIKKKVKIK